MLITGSTTCTHCEKEINWYYLVPQRDKRIMEADTIPKKLEKIFRYNHIQDNLYELQCYCMYCDRLNKFEYESDIPLHIN